MNSQSQYWMETNGQPYVPAALPAGNNLQYTLPRRLGEPHSRYGRWDKTLSSVRYRIPVLWIVLSVPTRHYCLFLQLFYDTA
jgi:hypothetical protein